MPSAERSVTINRPAAEVFEYVADGTRAMEWRPGVAETKLESGSGVGAVYRQSVHGPMRRRVKADYEITSYDPNKRIEFKTISGPVRPTGGYKLSESAGKTKLTFWLKGELGGWKRFVLGRSVQKSMDAEMKALDKLKSVLESGAAADAPAKAKSTTGPSGSGTPIPAPSKAGAARATGATAGSSTGSRAGSSKAAKAAAAKAAAAKPAAPRTARRKPKSS
jgi:uncharacterized protein YndB with AHSA1/START domain